MIITIFNFPLEAKQELARQMSSRKSIPKTYYPSPREIHAYNDLRNNSLQTPLLQGAYSPIAGELGSPHSNRFLSDPSPLSSTAPTPSAHPRHFSVDQPYLASQTIPEATPFEVVKFPENKTIKDTRSSFGSKSDVTRPFPGPHPPKPARLSLQSTKSDPTTQKGDPTVSAEGDLATSVEDPKEQSISSVQFAPETSERRISDSRSERAVSISDTRVQRTSIQNSNGTVAV